LIQSQEGDGGVSDKTGWEIRSQQLRARGTVWTLSRDLGPAKENNYALESGRHPAQPGADVGVRLTSTANTRTSAIQTFAGQ
jgi:hypothetical protein